MNATLSHVALWPRDGFFCMDGRGWHTSQSGRGHGLLWPWPSTVLGALRTGWGRGEEARSGEPFDDQQWIVRTAGIQLGRVLLLRKPYASQLWAPEHRVWPVPTDTLWVEGAELVQPLHPERPRLPTLGRDDDAEREALFRPVVQDKAKAMRPPRWWSETRFIAWLGGQDVRADRKDAAYEPSVRVQAHVGIRAEEQTGEEGILFSHDVVETLDRSAQWAIGAEVSIPREELPGTLTLGSDGRFAHLECVSDAVFGAPSALVNAFSGAHRGLRLVVCSPACFEHGWLPDGFVRENGVFCGRLPGISDRVVLRAAFVPRPVHISGWDMVQRAPKPTSCMVAPGATYFFEYESGAPFTGTEANKLWLASIGSRTGEGFGRVVPGVWDPDRSPATTRAS